MLGFGKFYFISDRVSRHSVCCSCHNVCVGFLQDPLWELLGSVFSGVNKSPVFRFGSHVSKVPSELGAKSVNHRCYDYGLIFSVSDSLIEVVHSQIWLYGVVVKRFEKVEFQYSVYPIYILGICGTCQTVYGYCFMTLMESKLVFRTSSSSSARIGLEFGVGV